MDSSLDPWALLTRSEDFNGYLMWVKEAARGIVHGVGFTFDDKSIWQST